MLNVTIFGKGNMGQAIGGLFEKAGQTVNYVDSQTASAQIGDLVVLAVPYPALAGIVANYGEKLTGKIIVDITNPVNFETFDALVVPADSSASAELAQQLPTAKIIKAFNTTFAATLASQKVANQVQTTVLMASDHADAKETLGQALQGSGVRALDAGSLKRARELEAFGFLQISLAASEKINWTGGFAVVD